jgi:hypothetical protein
MAVMGDSLIYGNSLGNAVTWVNKIGGKYDMTYYNLGDNGDTVANQTAESQPCMVNRYSSMANTLDYFVLLGGANDKRLNVPLGTVASTDPNTFMGALNVIINGVRAKYPQIKMLFMTNYNRFPNSPNSLGLNDIDYVSAMQQVCTAQGIPCFDNYHNSGVNFQNTVLSAWQDEGLSTGGTATTHLSDSAYTWLLPKYENALGAL